MIKAEKIPGTGVMVTIEGIGDQTIDELAGLFDAFVKSGVIGLMTLSQAFAKSKLMNCVDEYKEEAKRDGISIEDIVKAAKKEANGE